MVPNEKIKRISRIKGDYNFFRQGEGRVKRGGKEVGEGGQNEEGI